MANKDLTAIGAVSNWISSYEVGFGRRTGAIPMEKVDFANPLSVKIQYIQVSISSKLEILLGFDIKGPSLGSLRFAR